MLIQLAERLRTVFRETDSLVRWGGEEVLVLARETDRREAAELAARVCAAVRDQPFEIGPGETVHVTVSIGFCAFPLDPRHPRLWDWRACLALADSALYATKDQGTRRLCGRRPCQRPVAARGAGWAAGVARREAPRCRAQQRRGRRRHKLNKVFSASGSSARQAASLWPASSAMCRLSRSAGSWRASCRCMRRASSAMSPPSRPPQ